MKFRNTHNLLGGHFVWYLATTKPNWIFYFTVTVPPLKSVVTQVSLDLPSACAGGAAVGPPLPPLARVLRAAQPLKHKYQNETIHITEHSYDM